MLSVVVGLGNKDLAEHRPQRGTLGSCHKDSMEDRADASSTDQETQQPHEGAHVRPTAYLEEGEADVVLKDNAAYAPHIARLRPAQLCVERRKSSKMPGIRSPHIIAHWCPAPYPG